MSATILAAPRAAGISRRALGLAFFYFTLTAIIMLVFVRGTDPGAETVFILNLGTAPIVTLPQVVVPSTMTMTLMAGVCAFCGALQLTRALGAPLGDPPDDRHDRLHLGVPHVCCRREVDEPRGNLPDDALPGGADHLRRTFGGPVRTRGRRQHRDRGDAALGRLRLVGRRQRHRKQLDRCPCRGRRRRTCWRGSSPSSRSATS